MSDFFASLPTPGLFAASISRFLTQWFENGDKSVPGSTDGVLLMGIIIVLIIIIPTIVTRRRWMR